MVLNLSIELGYNLIPLVDREQEKNLLEQIKMIRRKVDHKLKGKLAPVHIRDDLMLKANEFRICVNGKEECLLSVDVRTSHEEQCAEIGNHILTIVLENQEKLFQ